MSAANGRGSTPLLSPLNSPSVGSRGSAGGSTTPRSSNFSAVSDTESFKQILSQQQKILAEDDDDEDFGMADLEYHVVKLNQYKKRQQRVVVLSPEKKTFVLLDSKTNKERKNYDISAVCGLEIPKGEDNSLDAPCTLKFKKLADRKRSAQQRDFQVTFTDEFERLHFCQEMATLNPKIVIDDRSNKQSSKECLKFTISKINNAGIKKTRLISVLTKGRMIQSFLRSKKPKTLLIAQISRVERSFDDKSRVDLFFKDRPSTNFIFENPPTRERFLGRIFELWKVQLQSGVQFEAVHMLPNSLKEGTLELKDGKKWIKRYIALVPNQLPQHVKDKFAGSRGGGGQIIIFKNKGDKKEQSRVKLDCNSMTQAIEDAKRDFTFCLVTKQGGDIQTFSTSSEENRRGWLGALKTLVTGDQLVSDSILDLEDRSVSLHVTTWNAGESKPPSPEVLFNWLGPPRMHDLIVVGLQECSKKRPQWISAIQKHVMGGVKDSYVNVSTVRLWDIMMLVLVKSEHSKFINHVEADTIPCGIGDVLGNKGGVGVAFRFLDTGLCFINCHLAARAERLSQRQGNYQRIITGLALGSKGFELAQFQHVIFFGDLNYRVDKTWDEALECVEKEDWVSMSNDDQLNNERNTGKVFLQYQEGELSFAPTYRWDKNENTFSNKRGQPPSYTDRILWRSFPGLEYTLQQTTYAGCPDILGSDHRPMYAHFNLSPTAPYAGVRLFRRDHPDAARHKHIEISMENVRIWAVEDGSILKQTSVISATLTSAVLIRKLSPPGFLFNDDMGAWALLNNPPIKLEPFVFDEDYLAKSHLLVSLTVGGRPSAARQSVLIKDGSVLVKETNDVNEAISNIFGVCVLSLQQAVAQSNFQVEIIRDGLCRGTMSGNWKIKHLGSVNPEETDELVAHAEVRRKQQARLEQQQLMAQRMAAAVKRATDGQSAANLRANRMRQLRSGYA